MAFARSCDGGLSLVRPSGSRTVTPAAELRHGLVPLPDAIAGGRATLAAYPVSADADQNLFVDTRATGHLLSAPQGLQHFLTAAQAAAAEIIILDPCIPRTIRMRTIPAPWPLCARACCACARLPSGVDCSPPRSQIHRPLRDRQCLPWLQRPACRWRQLPPADATFAPVQHRRTPFPVSLCGPAAATL